MRLWTVLDTAVFIGGDPSARDGAAWFRINPATSSVVGAGAGPHVSFAEVQFNQARWGDYSFAVPDPSGNGVWLATEYIPPPASQDPQDNWGTFVFEVSGH